MTRIRDRARSRFVPTPGPAGRPGRAVDEALLRRVADDILRVARSYGLDPIPTVYELIDFDEMNQVASYGGFPTRYPHWRFGMEYEEMKKGYEWGLSKIYELVINNEPCYAYLMRSNGLVDQKMVIAHVYGHSDFFKHNLWFSQTNRRMIDEMANHGTRIRRYVERFGEDRVEEFVDAALSLDNLVDIHSVYSPGRDRKRFDFGEEEDGDDEAPRRLPSKDYMDRFINPPEFLQAQRKKIEEKLQRKKHFPEEPEKDVLMFLIESAPLESWQRDVLSIVREEAYYFAPQAMTKIMNEGWACLESNMNVFTASGLLPISEVVAGHAEVVSDGGCPRAVYGRNILRDQETIRIRTRRGLKLAGSTNHRVLLPDRQTWRRLDELKPGDRIAISGGADLWPTRDVMLNWSLGVRLRLQDVAKQAGVSVWALHRYQSGRAVHRAAAVATALAVYESDSNQSLSLMGRRRTAVRIPSRVDEDLAAFLGYLVGDGHISRVKRNFGVTSGSRGIAGAFASLAWRLFGIRPVVRLDGNRWRALAHAETASDFLVEALGLTTGPSARQKRIPDAICRSPEPVVRAFLRAYFDCDAHAGPQGVILSTASDALAEGVQLLLLNYGILTRRRRQAHGIWHVHAAGLSARRFYERIGFSLARKQRALAAYVQAHRWFKEERWEDEVVGVERGRADVYDISVAETHRYAAAGFINHNSYWHSKILTEQVLADDEVLDYAEHHSGVLGAGTGRLNPYKLGMELYKDIEERWNKGKFGSEWDHCDDIAKKQAWDLQLGQGRDKIFEVRSIYNDVTFIDDFLTEDFCRENKMFVYKYNPQTNKYEISGRDFKEIKQTFLFRLTNLGSPILRVVDGNYKNRTELLLKHFHEGIDLDVAEAKDTLANLFKVWQRPVNLETLVNGTGKILTYNGHEHSEQVVTEA